MTGEIDGKSILVALEEIGTNEFERFGQAFYSAIAGRSFIPLGGMHDGGADGYFDPDTYGDTQAHHFLQISKQVTYDAKIKETLKRLKESGRIPKSITYLTSEAIKLIDIEEERLSDLLSCRILIRDRRFIESQINTSAATSAAFNSYLRPCLSYLTNPGAVRLASRTQRYTERTLTVFLQQEVDYRRGKSDLLEAVSDALIVWSLSDTDPQANKFMTRNEILTKIEGALPSAKQFIRGVIDFRLSRLCSRTLSVKARQIRSYGNGSKYCLPYETRLAVQAENISDSALKLSVSRVFGERLATLFGAIEPGLESGITGVCHSVIERVFERQGLQVAQFATSGDADEDLQIVVGDLVADVIDELGLERLGASVRRQATSILRQTFSNPTLQERTYLQKLSRTYVLLLLLKNEPKIVEYFKVLSAKFVLYVGTDFLVSALAEQFIPSENQTTRNLFKILRDAGSALVLTEKAVSELSTHIRSQIFEFENYYQSMESFITLETSEFIDRVLIRAYFSAKLDLPLQMKPPAGWRAFIEQFASYSAIRARGCYAPWARAAACLSM